MRRAPADERALLAALGVDRTAPWEELRRAFRAAVRASHPDLHFGDPDAERRLKALNAAWESINTPAKWAAYVAHPVGHTGARGSARGWGAAAIPALARVQVRRARRGSAGLLRWNIELDGEVVANIENGGSSSFDARPGAHTLRVFYASYSSLPLRVHLRRGQELALGCRQLEGVRVSLFSPKRSLVLEHLDERGFAREQ